MGYTWYTYNSSVQTKFPSLYLHRLIADRIGLGSRINHIDGDSLNCCRDNLRTITFKQASQLQCVRAGSITGVKGVNFVVSRQRYLARIMVDGQSIYLGYYATLYSATIARQIAEDKYFDFERVVK